MSKSKSDVNQSDEIELLELVQIVWDNKLRIFVITSLFAFISIIYAISLPNIYQADALLAPAEDTGNGSLANITNQFGGLASLAGVSISDESVSKVNLGLEVLKSRKFVKEFVKRHEIMPQLMAVDHWDANTRELKLDKKKFDEKSKTWIGKVPSDEAVYNSFIDIFVLEQGTSEFIRMGFKHRSPEIAANWTNLVIKDLNDTIRQQDINEAENSIAYLRQQIEVSPLTELRKLFYNLIQSQTETMMLANVRKEYVFKTIDPAIVPEFKSQPKRIFIFISGTFLGGLLSLMYIFFGYYNRSFNS